MLCFEDLEKALKHSNVMPWLLNTTLLFFIVAVLHRKVRKKMENRRKFKGRTPSRSAEGKHFLKD